MERVVQATVTGSLELRSSVNGTISSTGVPSPVAWTSPMPGVAVGTSAAEEPSRGIANVASQNTATANASAARRRPEPPLRSLLSDRSIRCPDPPAIVPASLSPNAR